MVKTGDKWGRVECIDIGQVARVQEFEGGGSDTTYFKAYTLRCECGNVIEVLVTEWLGKRATKDCGCGISSQDGVSVTMAISVPLSVREAIHQIAHKHTNGNMSMAITVAVRKFKASEESEEVTNATR